LPGRGPRQGEARQIFHQSFDARSAKRAVPLSSFDQPRCRGRVRVLDVDPVPRPARPIGLVPALRDDAFKPHSAGWRKSPRHRFLPHDRIAARDDPRHVIGALVSNAGPTRAPDACHDHRVPVGRSWTTFWASVFTGVSATGTAIAFSASVNQVRAILSQRTLMDEMSVNWASARHAAPCR
jgi:hypothetical protein